MGMRSLGGMAVFAAVAAFLLSSCGEGPAGAGKSLVMRLPECGLEMETPAGWKIEGPGVCSKEDYTGLFASEVLEGKTFEKVVDEMSAEFGAKLVSRADCIVAGMKAVKVISDASGMKILRLYIDCGDKIAYVSYVVLKEDFPSYEADFMKSIESMRKK